MTTMLYEKEWNDYLERKSHSEYVNSLLPDDSLLKTIKYAFTPYSLFVWLLFNVNTKSTIVTNNDNNNELLINNNANKTPNDI